MGVWPVSGSNNLFCHTPPIVMNGDIGIAEPCTRECSPEGLLKTRVYLDLVGINSAEEARERLLRTIREITAGFVG